MRVMRIVCVLAAVAAFVPSVAAGPPVVTNQLYGFITSNKTLSYAYPGPEYDVIGDLVIQPGVVLTIEPGVTLRIATSDLLNGGNYFYQVELDVQGQLVADATRGDSIRIISAGGGTGQWGEIRTSGGGTVTLRNLAIRGANRAVNLTNWGPHVLERVGVSAVFDGIHGPGASLILRECSITGYSSLQYPTGTGLAIGADATLASPDSTAPRPSTIAGFQTGIAPYAGALVRNVIVRDNFWGVEARGPSTVNYCTLVRNEYGISSYDLLVLNTIAVLNRNSGIRLLGGGAFGDYLDSWGNGTNFASGLFGPHVATFNPLFANANSNDFRLTTASPFRQFSNSGGEIGAYGPGPGLPTASRTASWGRVKALYR